MRSLSSLLALTPLAACGGLRHHLHADQPPPATLAVLPFAGSAPIGLRDAARALLVSHLRQRGYRIAEPAWVDRQLSERGLLRDPATVVLPGEAVATLPAQLGVAAVLSGTAVDESSFNIWVLRRHALSGTFAIVRADGSNWWDAANTAGETGGLLLGSGQLLTELRAQGDHATPMASLALADVLVTEVADTLPEPMRSPDDGAPPTIGSARVARLAAGDRDERLVIEVEASADATVRCAIAGLAVDLPLAADPGRDGLFRGACDVPAGTPVPRAVVTARSPYGLIARREVTP